jgi:hypothetical protein
MSKFRFLGPTLAVILGLSVLAWAQQPVTISGTATVDTELAAAAAAADNTANPTLTGVLAYQMCFDGSTWDRCTGQAADTELGAATAGADNMANPTAPWVLAASMCWDGTTWDRCSPSDGGSGTVSANTQRVTLATDVALPAGTNLLGSINEQAATSGGCTPGSVISAATVNETEVKATAGQLYSLQVMNTNAAARYIKFYNDTAANVDQTDTPVLRFTIPANSTTGAGFAATWPTGAAFGTAITFRTTTGAADNDTGAVAANEIIVSYCYK